MQACTIYTCLYSCCNNILSQYSVTCGVCDWLHWIWYPNIWSIICDIYHIYQKCSIRVFHFHCLCMLILQRLCRFLWYDICDMRYIVDVSIVPQLYGSSLVRYEIYMIGWYIEAWGTFCGYDDDQYSILLIYFWR